MIFPIFNFNTAFQLLLVLYGNDHDMLQLCIHLLFNGISAKFVALSYNMLTGIYILQFNNSCMQQFS